jgi:DNA-binding FrmR family transcriptional regulator
MIDEDKECPEILLQLAAVKAALDKASVILLEDHMEHCLVEAVKSGDVEPPLIELRAAMDKIF